MTMPEHDQRRTSWLAAVRSVVRHGPVASFVGYTGAGVLKYVVWILWLAVVALLVLFAANVGIAAYRALTG